MKMILNESLFEELKDKVEIEYNFDIERDEGNPSGYFDVSFGNYLPDEKWKTYNVDWVYKIETWEIIDVLMDLIKRKDPKLWEQIPEDEKEYTKYLELNFDTLYNRFEDDIYDYFYEEALEDAQDNWEKED